MWWLPIHCLPMRCLLMPVQVKRTLVINDMLVQHLGRVQENEAHRQDLQEQWDKAVQLREAARQAEVGA